MLTDITQERADKNVKKNQREVGYAALYAPDMATHGAPGLVPRPCCILCRQNIYFCLLRGLIEITFQISEELRKHR